MNAKALLLLIFISVHGSCYAQGVLDQKINTSEVDPSNLSDQDKALSEEFVHEGKSQREYDELCGADKKTNEACRGIEADPKVFGLDSSMVSALSKAYTMVIGSGATGKLVTQAQYEKENPVEKGTGEEATQETNSTQETSSTEEGTTDSDKGDKKGEDDYCKYVAVATEVISTAKQTTAQKGMQNIPTGQETAQKEALYQTARSHGERSDNAKIQTTGWGATTACYAAMMAKPSISKSAWQNWAKVGAAGLLTIFYKKQVDAHKDYQDKAKSIADKLPGKGDCNPVTERNCYCAQEETKYDPKYCAEEIREEKLAGDSLMVTCVDENMKSDPECSCSKTNSCIDKKISTKIDLPNLSGNLAQTSFSPFKSMVNGELKSGKLSGGDGKVFATAQMAMKQANSKIPSKNVKLTDTQKKEVKALQKVGVPLKLATTIASSPLTPEAKKKMASFQGATTRGSYKRSNYQGKKRSKVISFGGGDGLNAAKKSSRKSSRFDPLKKFKKSNKKNSNSTIRFAEQASKDAEISKNTDKPIFEIISRRYQVSGFKRLKLVK